MKVAVLIQEWESEMSSVFVYESLEKAYVYLAAYCREHWTQYDVPKTLSKVDKEAIDTYYLDNDYEWYTLEIREVQ